MKTNKENYLLSVIGSAFGEKFLCIHWFQLIVMQIIIIYNRFSASVHQYNFTVSYCDAIPQRYKSASIEWKTIETPYKWIYLNRSLNLAFHLAMVPSPTTILGFDSFIRCVRISAFNLMKGVHSIAIRSCFWCITHCIVDRRNKKQTACWCAQRKFISLNTIDLL